MSYQSFKRCKWYAKQNYRTGLSQIGKICFLFGVVTGTFLSAILCVRLTNPHIGKKNVYAGG